MNVKPPACAKAAVGVIIGRFQVPDLHPGHLQLFKHVVDHHQKTIIFLGLAHFRGTRENALDFEARKQMILEKFPNVIVLYMKDCRKDKIWSRNLDRQIEDVASHQSVALYGSRDSFAKHYFGKYPVIEMEQEHFISGSEIRAAIAATVKPTSDFRHGVISNAYNQYPRLMPTVDAAIFDENDERLLLAQKPDEEQYRFVGGFVEAGEPGKVGLLEANTIREVAEETHLEVGDLQYICSMIVDDWRLRREKDKIPTTFFYCKRVFGNPVPDDDISALKWFDFATIKEEDVVEEHRPLLKALKEFMGKKVVFRSV